MFPHRRDRLSRSDFLVRLAARFAPLQKGFGQQSLCPRIKAGTLSKEMPPHVTCETVICPGSPGTTRFSPLGVSPWGRPSRPFPHLSGSPLGLSLRDLLHLRGVPSGWTCFPNLRGVPSGGIQLPHLRWAPSGRTRRNFPHLRWGCYCRGYVFPRRWSSSATHPTGLGPSVLFILLFLEAPSTDVLLPLGILHQQVHWHVGGIMFAHIGANLLTQPLHIATFHLSFRVSVTTQATLPP